MFIAKVNIAFSSGENIEIKLEKLTISVDCLKVVKTKILNRIIIGNLHLSVIQKEIS